MNTDCQPSLRRFLPFWAAQTLSVTGGGLTTFALGVWVFEQTGSASLYALLAVCTTLPGIVALPLAGVLADRLGPRRALLLAEGAGLATGVLLAALFATRLAAPTSIYLILTVGALLTSVHWPAYTRATTVLSPPEFLPKAAAIMQLGYAGQQVVAPIVAAAALAALGVAGVIGLNVLTFGVGVAAVLLTTLPGPGRAELAAPALVELREAWSVMRSSGLLRLVLYIVLTYLPGGFVVALATPLVLSLADVSALGWVQAMMGVGMVVGSLAAGLWAGRTGSIGRLLRYDAVMALAMCSVGFAASPLLIGLAGFAFLFGLAGLMAEEQVVWQLRIDEALQGRVVALRRTLTWASLPVSYALAGPLADFVFEPLMASGGALAPSLGQAFGTGTGRGIALLIVCAGLVKLALIFCGSRDPRLRRLDGVPEEQTAGNGGLGQLMAGA